MNGFNHCVPPPASAPWFLGKMERPEAEQFLKEVRREVGVMEKGDGRRV